MPKLWQKSGTKMHPAVNDYIISKNLAADTSLLPYDIEASIAQAKMLGHVRIITPTESADLVRILKEILKLFKSGKFKLAQENEDCHTAIENYLTEKLGETGKKIHMGRSRNDQVLVAMRLFTRDALMNIQKNILNLATTILTFAKKYEFVPMPGFTHTQQAMLSSVGQWAGAFVESLLDDHEIVVAAANLNNQNPMGSAAGFGTSLPLDRNLTTRLLGFKKLQLNALYCQNSRGKIESMVVHALTQVMMTLGKIANDVVWFTSKEFSFFNVDHSLTTGSSIMPQKHNVDIMEVVRANVAVVMSYGMQIQTVSHNLLSGYNKDLKVTKQSLMESLSITESSLGIVKILFEHMTPNQPKLATSFLPEIFATDNVNALVEQGVPFRDAYRKVGESLQEVKLQDPIKNLKSKKHLGAPGNLALGTYALKLKKLSKEI